MHNRGIVMEMDEVVLIIGSRWFVDTNAKRHLFCGDYGQIDLNRTKGHY